MGPLWSYKKPSSQLHTPTLPKYNIKHDVHTIRCSKHQALTTLYAYMSVLGECWHESNSGAEYPALLTVIAAVTKDRPLCSGISLVKPKSPSLPFMLASSRIFALFRIKNKIQNDKANKEGRQSVPVTLCGRLRFFWSLLARLSRSIGPSNILIAFIQYIFNSFFSVLPSFFDFRCVGVDKETEFFFFLWIIDDE